MSPAARPSTEAGMRGWSGGGGAGTVVLATTLGALAGGEVSIKSSGRVEETGGRVEETGGRADDTAVGFMSSCLIGSVVGPN